MDCFTSHTRSQRCTLQNPETHAYKISQLDFQMCSYRHIPVLDDYLQQPELQKLMSGLQACRQEIGSSVFSGQKNGNKKEKRDGSNCVWESPISKTVTTFEKE